MQGAKYEKYYDTLFFNITPLFLLATWLRRLTHDKTVGRLRPGGNVLNVTIDIGHVQCPALIEI